MAAGLGRRIARAPALILSLALSSLIIPPLILSPAASADLDAPPGYGAGPAYGGGPRFFPRGDGIERPPRYGGAPRPLRAGCIPRQVPVPTDAPDDPSYVGSEYGLSHPSYYGFTPPLGVDDPYGRSLLPYCP